MRKAEITDRLTELGFQDAGRNLFVRSGPHPSIKGRVYLRYRSGRYGLEAQIDHASAFAFARERVTTFIAPAFGSIMPWWFRPINAELGLFPSDSGQYSFEPEEAFQPLVRQFLPLLETIDSDDQYSKLCTNDSEPFLWVRGYQLCRFLQIAYLRPSFHCEDLIIETYQRHKTRLLEFCRSDVGDSLLEAALVASRTHFEVDIDAV